MTTPPPTNPDDLPTGPLPKPHTLGWAFVAILVLALLGYSYFTQRAIGREVPVTAPQSGRGLPPPEGPTSTR